MRKDIKINTQTHDIIFDNQNSTPTYPFKWVLNGDLTIQGQITIPYDLPIEALETTGIKVSIPYTPVYKPIEIKIIRQVDKNSYTTILNPVNRKEWFNLYSNLYNKNQTQIKASQLIMLGGSDYIIQIKEGDAYIWSSNKTDFINSPANIQNRNLLLQCIPSNSYRYPAAGVGTIRYLHSVLSQSDLADRLQKEFKADRVTVKNAAFDPFTGDLDLDLDFSEADNGDI